MKRWYAYVDGSDLHDLEDELVFAFESFAAGSKPASVTVINHREPPNPNDRPGDLPIWTLGLNLEFDRLGQAEIAGLLAFLEFLAKRTGRKFAIGCVNANYGTAEDVCFVTADDDATKSSKNCELLAGLAE